jgi:NAD(P)-dependent dehydrogenase (short-subunit alcohol dehydrogenase family)
MRIHNYQEDVMTMVDKAVLVTGANRGIGQALVEEALRRGARRVYAGTQHLAVNLFGPYGVSQAFLPLLTRSRGAIVNVLSLAALAAMPLDPGYSMSKAAAFSLTQSLRALLAGQGVTVHAVLPGPVDTDMGPKIDIPKASAESVARAIFDGVERQDQEIFPDPMSETMAEAWRNSASKELERQMATFVDAQPVGP